MVGLPVLLIVLLVTCCIKLCRPTQSSSLSFSAFCQSYKPIQSFGSMDHPMSVPEMHIPWVWEAVHDPVEHHVDISVITPNACSFNKTAWSEFSLRFPMYGKYMGDGLSSNVLVSSDCEGRKTYLHHVLGILGRKMVCVFHKNGSVVLRHHSLRVRLKMPTFGPLVIRCPVPAKLQFDAMQIEVREGFSPFCFPEFGVSSIGYNNGTKVFPVCTLPHYSKTHKKYDLSILSATARSDEAKMAEWIEYHRLMGVQHFILYNTATVPSIISSVNKILAPYVTEGLVTLVPWHFLNCVRGMGSGRLAYYYTTNANYNKSDPLTWRQRSSFDLHTFRPPHPIANYGALMSGYSRFRHTSKYMLYVDDDEFVSLSDSNVDQNLVAVADSVFSLNPNSSAIYFMPIDMNDCPDVDKKKNRTPDTTLPRLGHLLYGYVGDYHLYEHKPLMRTDMVTLFSVHYVSLLEANFHNESVNNHEYYYPLGQGALLHYKTPAHISGDLFSFNHPLPIPENVTQSFRCKESHRTVDPYQTGLYKDLNITGHVQSTALKDQLLKGVYKRLVRTGK